MHGLGPSSPTAAQSLALLHAPSTPGPSAALRSPLYRAAHSLPCWSTMRNRPSQRARPIQPRWRVRSPVFPAASGVLHVASYKLHCTRSHCMVCLACAAAAAPTDAIALAHSRQLFQASLSGKPPFAFIP